MTITRENLESAQSGDALHDTRGNYYEILLLDFIDQDKIIIYTTLFNKPILIIYQNGIFYDNSLNPIAGLNHPFASLHFHPTLCRR